MELTNRQRQIIQIVKDNEPISGESIASELGLSRSTLRSDLAVLTMTGILDARPKVGYIYSGLGFEPLLHDELNQKRVKDIMISPVIIKQDTTVRDAITDLFMYDVGSLYITDDADKLIGLVSRKDLLRSVVMGNQADAPVAVIMTRMPNIFVTHPEMPVMEAGRLITRHQIDSLPVVKEVESKDIVGKITKTTLVNLLIELGETQENYE